MIWIILAQIIFLFTFGWWGLLFIPIIVLIVLITQFGVSRKPTSDTFKNEQNSLNNYSEIKYKVINDTESNSRLRVLNESFDIIGTTNNLTTLNSRFNDVMEHLEWFCLSGVELNGRSTISAISEANKFANENIVRIAKYSYDKTISDMKVLKTQTAKEKRIVKLFELIKLCKSSLKNNANIELYISELQDIHFKAEELYSAINS